MLLLLQHVALLTRLSIPTESNAALCQRFSQHVTHMDYYYIFVFSEVQFDIVT